MGALATAWKFRDVGYLLAMAVLVIWLQGLRLEITGTGLKIVSARLEAEEKARDLSDQLEVAKRRAMALNANRETIYVDRIRNVPVNAACPADDGDRAAARGVRDIIRGAPDAAGGRSPGGVR